MTPRRRKLWSYTAGEYPSSVTVGEKVAGGMLYARLWDPTRQRQVRQSLQHRDREAAREFADEAARKLRAGVEAAEARGPLTVGAVLALYLVHRTPQKASVAVQVEDRRRALLWERYLGARRAVATLGEAEWHNFVTDRRTGLINARGEVVADATQRVEVGQRGVDADLVFIVSVFNWALSFRVQGRRLLRENPWGVPAPGIKRHLERPRNRAPLRPVATYDRFLALMDVAPLVLMQARKDDPDARLVVVGFGHFGPRKTLAPARKWMKPSYLPELLELAEQTGRRISAICRLQYDDVIRDGGVIMKIRWRPFKKEDEVIVPVSDATRATLDRVLRARPGVGAAPMFPNGRTPMRAITRWLARDWMDEAEQIAELPHLEGGAWHPYRRKWGTERKHLPTVDVMLAGGWRDERSLKNSYQHADEETMLTVVNEPKKLVARVVPKGVRDVG